MKTLYRRTDQWIQDLPRGAHAALFGLVAAVAYATAGLVIDGELQLLRALVMGVVFFVVYFAFGRR